MTLPVSKMNVGIPIVAENSDATSCSSSDSGGSLELHMIIRPPTMKELNTNNTPDTNKMGYTDIHNFYKPSLQETSGSRNNNCKKNRQVPRRRSAKLHIDVNSSRSKLSSSDSEDMIFKMDDVESPSLLKKRKNGKVSPMVSASPVDEVHPFSFTEEEYLSGLVI